MFSLAAGDDGAMEEEASGLFLSLEGIEGSGKSTQAGLLAKRVKSLGRECVLTREPGGSETGERIREILVGGNAALDPLTETLLLGAARHEHMRELILPALKRGACVISDRFQDSTFAYQHYARGLSAEIVKRINGWVVGGRCPDKSFVLRLAPAAARRRLRLRERNVKASPYDRESEAFHLKVQKGYEALAEKYAGRVLLIEADRAPDALHEELWRHVAPLLEEKGKGGKREARR